MTLPDVSRVKYCACGSLRKATRELTIFYDQVLKPSNIHITQFTFLVFIAREGEHSVTELADKLAMDQTTVTRNLRQMEEQGLIERKTGLDKRVRLVTLTPLGQETLSTAIPLWEQAQAQITEGMGQERFRSALKEVRVMVEQVRGL